MVWLVIIGVLALLLLAYMAVISDAGDDIEEWR